MPLDKVKIKQSFAHASSTYDPAADLQRTVAHVLLEKLLTLTGTVLDIGCGTGFLSQQLLSLQPTHVISLDIALPMLHTAQSKLGTSVQYICADAEALPFANHSMDLIISNLALQWCSNLTVVFKHSKRILKPNGRLLFSTFAPRTLQELKTAWATVDDYSHVNDFYDEAQLQEFLQLAGFSNIQITRILYTRYYDSVLALMRELKHIGAHNVRSERNKHCTTKTAMQTMMYTYQTLYGKNEQIPASYDVFIVEAT